MLTMNYTYRIYPNVVQQTELRSWLETCRGVYNYALRELKDWIASRKCSIDRCSLEKEYIIPADEPFPSYHRQQNNLPKAKKQFPHLGKVHSQVLQTTIRRLHDTWEVFQKRGYGFPRFKKFGQFKSFVFPQFTDNPINGFIIKLPKIGEVPIKLHRPIPNGFKVKQVRVLLRVRGTQWYVVVTIESDISVPDVPVPVHVRAIGIDLGLERFLTASDGSFQERPQFFKSMQRKLKLLQRRAARKQKGSQNWQKAQVEVARMHHRIANRRKDFHLKTAHQLCDRAQTIFAEDLNVKGLTRGMLRKDCVDAAFGQFLSLTEWVCWKRGVYFAKVNPNGTSQTCPNCLATVSKGLEVREHHCPECGYRTHRDRAAAEMVLDRGLENVVSQGLWGTETACQVGLSGVYDLDKWRGAGILNREVGKPAL
ncbi:transposase [Oxynema sp. CENA135]|uniref:RNA-guided endonuclease InsQ/TnpB family protein n=1 Tax=Oxynema sp. CENA135 TaxID=984206 RepID=UPI00190ADC4C|nr:RNA-guided endonuclease TnpB family protein [Oxynema sp. CENA135]MBK4730856.1 transposase [Oxynema sp. CENA135]